MLAGCSYIYISARAIAGAYILLGEVLGFSRALYPRVSWPASFQMIMQSRCVVLTSTSSCRWYGPAIARGIGLAQPRAVVLTLMSQLQPGVGWTRNVVGECTKPWRVTSSTMEICIKKLNLLHLWMPSAGCRLTAWAGLVRVDSCSSGDASRAENRAKARQGLSPLGCLWPFPSAEGLGGSWRGPGEEQSCGGAGYTARLSLPTPAWAPLRDAQAAVRSLGSPALWVQACVCLWSQAICLDCKRGCFPAPICLPWLCPILKIG